MDDFYAARDNTMPSLPWPSIAPPFTAALLLGMIESFGTYLFPQYPGIFFLLALAVILLVKPSGIMGKEQTA
ncbi:branched-chain amino acid transport system permease protein/branched-chain amino acid transport system permease protein [Lutimaribacter pacificus]|uniref:hypothetical protein n=1 Tax=Lutimaribacter pacificus TaxID=391948 RepID=UPI0008909BC5|nr:hypothetical protein [Lutimaribacter pacificus]SDO73933.1 branched-chain amino acid transport system permease protein/branched-chain amino acid transport system permease protein [Lutimaribacter pacificus]